MLMERGGRFVVAIDGAGGGTWCLDFGAAAVSKGLSDADVSIRLSLAQFVSLSSGRVELRKLIVDGEVACEGERARLEDLSLVLAFLAR
jgi:alkyl sulfatase BDS1-like metallo-beta-lactamase superfamily hydrolase